MCTLECNLVHKPHSAVLFTKYTRMYPSQKIHWLELVDLNYLVSKFFSLEVKKRECS